MDENVVLLLALNARKGENILFFENTTYCKLILVTINIAYVTTSEF